MTARLALVLALALALRLAFFCGLRGSDDLAYAAQAKDHAEGAPLIPPGTQPYDVGLLRPAFPEGVSLAVRLFGFSEASLMLYPFLCSLALVALAYLSARIWIGEGAALAAGLLAAGLPGLVLASSSLYPDLPMALWVSASLALLWGAPGWGRKAALASGLAFALAVHHKETALMSLPVLLLLGLTRARRGLAPWTLAALAAGLALGWGGYLSSKISANLRHIAYRQSTLDPTTVEPALNPTMGTTSSLSGRLLKDFTGPLFNPLRPGPFSLWAGIAWLAAGGAWLALKERSSFLKACAVWALLAFLALDAFGLPGRGYFPMHPVSPRYLAFVIPPLLLLAGAFAAWAWTRLGRMRWAAAGGAAALLLACNVSAAAPNRPYGRVLRTAVRIVRSERPEQVWTDDRTAAGLALFLGPGTPVRILEAGSPPPASGIVVLNGPVLDFLRRQYGAEPPAWAEAPPPGWIALADEPLSRAGRLRILRAGPSGGGMPGLLGAAVPVRATSEITPRQRVVVTLIGLGLIAFIFELVRRRRLREDYSWLWMLSGAVILFFALYDPALLWITRLIGAGLPTTTFFFFGLFFLILISIHYAVKISTLTTQQKNLMQELALLKEQLERERKP